MGAITVTHGGNSSANKDQFLQENILLSGRKRATQYYCNPAGDEEYGRQTLPCIVQNIKDIEGVKTNNVFD